MDNSKRTPNRGKSFLNSAEEQEMSASQTETPSTTVRSPRDAALRAEQIRRNRSNEEIDMSFHDDFYIDPRVIPDGWDYNWKRYTIAGQNDPTYEVELAQGGWEPVDCARHPEMMPLGSKGAIIRKGMMLMERPKEISDAAKQREIVAAREAVEIKERALGQNIGNGYEKGRKTINKQYSPVEIPRS